MKKLEMEQTKPTIVILVLKVDIKIVGLIFFFIIQNYLWKESVHGLLEITWLE